MSTDLNGGYRTCLNPRRYSNDASILPCGRCDSTALGIAMKSHKSCNAPYGTEWLRVLKPGGVLLAQVPYGRQCRVIEFNGNRITEYIRLILFETIFISTKSNQSNITLLSPMAGSKSADSSPIILTTLSLSPPALPKSSPQTNGGGFISHLENIHDSEKGMTHNMIRPGLESWLALYFTLCAGEGLSTGKGL